MRNAMRWALSLPAASMLVAAGCGSDDGGDGGSGDGSEAAAAPSKAEYIAEADRICERSKSALRPLVADQEQAREQSGAASSEQEGIKAANAIADVLDRTVAEREKATAELQALEAPEGGGADDFFQARNESDAAVGKEAAAWRAFAADPSAATGSAVTKANQAAVKAGAQVASAAAAYGFKVCGKPIG